MYIILTTKRTIASCPKRNTPFDIISSFPLHPLKRTEVFLLTKSRYFYLYNWPAQ